MHAKSFVDCACHLAATLFSGRYLPLHVYPNSRANNLPLRIGVVAGLAASPLHSVSLTARERRGNTNTFVRHARPDTKGQVVCCRGKDDLPHKDPSAV